MRLLGLSATARATAVVTHGADRTGCRNAFLNRVPSQAPPFGALLWRRNRGGIDATDKDGHDGAQ